MKQEQGYFSFTRKERTGILVLVGILIMVALLPRIFPASPPLAEVVPEIQEHKAYSSSWVETDSAKNNRYREEGFGEEAKNKRGEKVKKGKERWVSYRENRMFAKRNDSLPYRPTKRYAPVDINEADTTQLIALPGIGSKLAVRIVSFRRKLGGFTHVNQIGQVYGLSDSVFRRILPLLRCGGDVVKKD